MRIEFLTQDDPVYILPFFDEFLRNYGSAFTIVQISSCVTMGKRSRLQLLRELTLLYGGFGMIRLLHRVAKAKLMGKLPRGRDSSRYYSLEQIARAYGIPYQRIENPNEKEFVDSVRARSAEVLVSVACPFILKGALLSLPPRGCINIHHAPLPRYKGMMPTFWQLYHGEKKVGVTVHYMTAQIDEGAALYQGELEVQPRETLDHLICRSKRHGAHCMARVLREIASQNQERVVLRQESTSYFSFPKPEEIREFRRRGYRAI